MMFSAMGLKMYFTRLVLAHIVLTIPYVVRTMLASFAGVKRLTEEAAIVLGASPFKTFFLVTLPQVKSALAASAFLSIIMSFDELVVALFLTGPGMTTLPMIIYSDTQFNLSPSLAAISSLIITATVAIGFIMVAAMQRKKKF
jgi:putative spermidine/putrescine transport system permease protein